MKPTLTLLTGLLLASLAVVHAAESTPPIVGAIRWDAWYGETGPVKHTEASLGPPKYHYRLPWFARVVGEGRVRINGDSQEILEKEITYAAAAGLNYWAFVDYWDDPSMDIALRRYRAAKDKKDVRYCFIEEGQRMDAVGTGGWARLIEHFKDPHYQTVLDGRPLLFLFVKSKRLGKREWQELGDAAVAAGLKRPYLVLMGWWPETDAKDMASLGFDAVSAYARGGSYSMEQPAYAEQCALIRRDRWEKCRALRIPSVTFASAGWDTRPRNERPPPWIAGVAATPDRTPPAQQKPLMDAVTATPDELAAHIHEALDWTKQNRDINPSNAIIIYGWNENDEGGWLIPTLGADGVPNEERIQALSKVLRASALAPVPQSSTRSARP
ncbi:MAG: glycoside hydrolase family 99-like domain-containing protein [Verrucomicrobia bacterium]|nr:glycoside hydrolase family 99-like domain-containing protein [Verrucomicrobiota bacterium]